MSILAVNVGSSSLKFALYPVDVNRRVDAARLTGNIEGLEQDGNTTLCWQHAGKSGREALPAGNEEARFQAALMALRARLAEALEGDALQAVAHRVVHGGECFTAAVLVDDAVLEKLSRLNPLAPLHQPHNLEGIRNLQQGFPGVPQVACFDTAFHATLPARERAFALPASLSAQGIRRYGFHGLSYQSVQQRLSTLSARGRQRVVMAHLGNGASLCATLEGRSQATTMGFSALDGLMMGTRSGAIDAGVLLHLLQQGWNHDALEKLLYRQSGLLGVSGIAADMRTLRASDAPAARAAIELFTYRVLREIGAMSACIGGLDVLAFTGGIGEHDCVLRAEVCAQLAYLGVRLDAAKNQSVADAASAIHAGDSRVEVWVVPTDEGRMAAQAAAELLR
jgi:acetate kinase